MVPVLDSNRNPLMPCSEKRARKLMNRGEAMPWFFKGFFCVKLIKEPSNRQYQDVAVGIDPGSKREGYTVATRKTVVLNITTDTYGKEVKEKLETRKILRRARRFRKTPYRKSRKNRASIFNRGIVPSTKARWDAKLRVLFVLRKILPITVVNVEDIKAVSKEGRLQWNRSFLR